MQSRARCSPDRCGLPTTPIATTRCSMSRTPSALVSGLGSGGWASPRTPMLRWSMSSAANASTEWTPSAIPRGHLLPLMVHRHPGLRPRSRVRAAGRHRLRLHSDSPPRRRRAGAQGRTAPGARVPVPRGLSASPPFRQCRRTRQPPALLRCGFGQMLGHGCRKRVDGNLVMVIRISV